MIFVIDIRNYQRIQESLSYLSDVVEEFKKLEIEPPIFIFFHKYDPALTRNSYEEIDRLVLYLRDKILGIPNYNKFYFRNTTIYNLSTVISAMSEILLMLYPKTDLIQHTIYEFGIKSNAEGIAVISRLPEANCSMKSSIGLMRLVWEVSGSSFIQEIPSATLRPPPRR